MEAKMVTSALELPGYQIDGNVGIVRGIVVRSRSIVGSFLGGASNHLRRQYHNLHQLVRAGAKGRLQNHVRPSPKERRKCHHWNAL